MRPVTVAFLLVLALTVTPYVTAALFPPPGTAFIGTFYYGDDFYNYLSYAQQAENGSLLFQNKVLLREHPPALLNPEWWLVGRLSALLGGGRLLVSYRLFAAFTALGFLAVTDRWLRRLGLDEAHRLWSLILVSTGGGLGGVLFTFAGRGLRDSLDIYAGLFPFLGLLTNPHFTAGTTLLLLSLLLFETAGTARARVAAIAAATALALVRPYDLVVLVLVRTAAVLVLEPRRTWLVKLLPLAGLVPVVLYLYWLFYRNSAFAFYADAPYTFPPLSSFAWALGPAALVALLAFRRPAPDPARRARVHLAAWAGLGLLVMLVRPVHFSLQFLVGVGLPLLALGAFGLGLRAPRATLLAALLFSTSQVAVLRFVSRPRPEWFVPKGDWDVVQALRPTCVAGDVLFAPASVGILAYGLTPCRAFISHRIDPAYGEKLADLQRFSSLGPRERSALLDAYRITHLLLPGDAGLRPGAWLGTDTVFRRTALVTAGPVWGLYLRERGADSP